jgi:hypothetical protein
MAMDKAILKVNKVSSANGGNGTIIMASITRSNSGTPIPLLTSVKIPFVPVNAIR